MDTGLTIIFFSILFCFSFLLLFYSSVFSSYFFIFLSSSLELHMWVFTVCNKEVPDKGSCQYSIRNALLMLAYVELLGTSRSSCKFRKWGGGEVALPTHACGCAIYRSETTTCIGGGGTLAYFLGASTFVLSCHWPKDGPVYTPLSLRRTPCPCVPVMFIIICNSSSPLFESQPRAWLIKRLKGADAL